MAIDAVIFQLHFFYGREGAACLVRSGPRLCSLPGLTMAAHTSLGEKARLVEFIGMHVMTG